MFEIEEQLRTLLRLEFWGNIRLAGGVWVLLLVGRGFPCFKWGWQRRFPCGQFLLRSAIRYAGRRSGPPQDADCQSDHVRLLRRRHDALTVYGRVCLAMALNAMAYNLASGTREAIT